MRFLLSREEQYNRFQKCIQTYSKGTILPFSRILGWRLLLAIINIQREEICQATPTNGETPGRATLRGTR